jgi:hypothetical protein
LKSTRRLFLKETGLVTVAALLPVSAFSQERLTAETNAFDPENLSRLDGITAETFDKWVGSTFRVSLDGQSMGSLLLSKVETVEPQTDASLPPGAEWIGRRITPAAGVELTSFLLIFKRTGSMLPQQTYMLDHKWLGRFPLLLVPAGTKGRTLVASFSVLKQKAAA